MVNIQEFQHCVIGVTSDRTAVLLDGPPSLYRVMESPVLGDHCQPEGFDSLPNSPGLYAATIEYWWHPGLSSGMPAHVDFFAKDVKRVSIEGLATDRYRRCLESSGIVGRLAARVSSAFHLLRALVHPHRPTPKRHVQDDRARWTRARVAAAIILMGGFGGVVLLGPLIRFGL